jgi:hypothetical protein
VRPEKHEDRQLSLLAVPKSPAPTKAATRSKPTTADFDGDTIAAFDCERLGRQLAGVLGALERGGWWTLGELVAVAGGSESGCSARVRDLRKPKFGGHVIERRRRGDPRAGLWEYAMRDRGDDDRR